MANRILHLEEDADFSASVQAVLSSAGGLETLRRAASVGEIQAALDAGDWDLLLAECGSHACADFAALEEALRLRPALPCIVLSSAPVREAAALSLRLGAADWVAKTDLGRLGFAVERALRAGRRMEALRKERDEARAASQAAAEGAARSRERLMAAVSQEIRTPLNGVLSMINLLAETDLDPKQRQFADVAQAAAGSLMRILRGILDFSREEGGRLRLEERPLDLQEAVADAVALRTDAAGGAGPGARKLYPRAGFADLRILVAEDNGVNQAVMTGMLEALGCRGVDVVADGREALAAFRRRAYDVVFMDCQMPHLDGWEATGRIRGLEAGERRGRRCLIAAITADVMPGAEAKCRAAGMDAFLAKPFVVEEMVGVLERARTPAAERPGAGPAPRPPPGEGARGDLDLRILFRLRVLAGEESPAAFRDLVRGFVRQGAEQLAELREGARDPDFRALAFAAHGLKGLSLNFGAVGMARECEALQLAAEGERADELDRVLERLAAAEARTRAACEELLAADAVPGDRRGDG